MGLLRHPRSRIVHRDGEIRCRGESNHSQRVQSDGLRIANVSNIEPGNKILLAYGGTGTPYTPLFCCTVKAAASPVRSSRHSFDVFTYIDDSLTEGLRNADYTPDPVLQRFVGIAIGDMRDLRHLS